MWRQYNGNRSAKQKTAAGGRPGITVWNKRQTNGRTRKPQRESKQSHLRRPGTGTRYKKRQSEDNGNRGEKQNKATWEGLGLVRGTKKVSRKTMETAALRTSARNTRSQAEDKGQPPGKIQKYKKSSRSQAPVRKGLALVFCRPKNKSGNKKE